MDEEETWVYEEEACSDRVVVERDCRGCEEGSRQEKVMVYMRIVLLSMVGYERTQC